MDGELSWRARRTSWRLLLLEHSPWRTWRFRLPHRLPDAALIAPRQDPRRPHYWCCCRRAGLGEAEAFQHVPKRSYPIFVRRPDTEPLLNYSGTYRLSQAPNEIEPAAVPFGLSDQTFYPGVNPVA